MRTRPRNLPWPSARFPGPVSAGRTRQATSSTANRADRPTRQTAPNSHRRWTDAPATRLTSASGGRPRVADARTVGRPVRRRPIRPHTRSRHRAARPSARPENRACSRPDPRRAASKSTSLPTRLARREGEDHDHRAGGVGAGRGDQGIGLGVDQREQCRDDSDRGRERRLAQPVHRPSAASSRTTRRADQILTASTATAMANATASQPRASAPTTPALLAAFASGDQLSCHTRRSTRWK